MRNLVLPAAIVIIQITAMPAFSEVKKLDVVQIEKVTEMKGELNEKEGVFKLSYPRKDLKVTIAGVKANPAMGLTAWVAFTKPKDHVIVMGDIVMTEGQVNDVMSAALDSGLEVTALHNHFFGETPKIMFMHIGGMGSEEELSRGVKSVFDSLKKTANQKFPVVLLDPAKTNLDPKKIDAILGHPSTLKDGVYKVTVGRSTKMMGEPVGNAMGVNTWAAFIGSDKEAVVDGDFAMLESEVQGVLKALRHSGINIVAIHNHMAEENPRVVFLHFWGVGPTEKLAQGLKSALETQKL